MWCYANPSSIFRDRAETQLAQLARAQSILATFPQADIGRFEVDETYREQCFVDALLARSDAAAVEKLWTLARELNVDAWRVSWVRVWSLLV